MELKEKTAKAGADKPTDRLSNLFRGSVLALGLVALLGLLGYLPGLELVGRIRAGYIPMAPSTAGSFLILCFVLYCLERKGRSLSWLSWCDRTGSGFRFTRGRRILRRRRRLRDEIVVLD